ncbi:MAG: clostripain-related cysteine peptidase [Elusimicrobia bacterium]|nr:clostripain-related cysteine peptidase [Elusimicrobiota bacterium]
MLKKLFVGIVACASLLGAGNAAAEKFDFDQGVSVKDIVARVQAETARLAAPKAGKASWTVMVYINAKNNLESYGLKDVNEMELVGSTDKVKIAVELGRIQGFDSSDGNWTGQRRYIIAKDKDTSKVTSPVLQEIPKADMGSWNHLVEFANWARDNAPADHYMLVVWNHGSGWNKAARRGSVVVTGISYDDETGNHMTTQDLGQALAALGKIDIYASDACLMQMAEVGYQIKDHVDYIVQSEETEPGDGYTYDTMLAPLAAKPAMSSAELAKVAVDAYTAHYTSLGQGATQSAVKASALGRLLAMLGEWTEAVIAANETAAVKAARNQTQDFYYTDNKDLLHFVKLLTAGSKNEAVKSKGAELERFLANEVITANAATGSNYQNALGLAIYLPSYGYDSDYDALAWAKGGWAKFVKWQKDIRDGQDVAQK